MNLGIIFNKICAGQILFDLIFQLDKLDKSNLSIVLFSDNVQWVPIEINYPILPLAEAYFADYTIIANNIRAANKLRYFPCAERKLYFIHTLEWLYVQNRKWSDLNNIYNSPELELIVPSQDYFDYISKLFKKPKLVRNFNLKEIL